MLQVEEGHRFTIRAGRPVVARERSGIAAGSTGVDIQLPEQGSLVLRLVDEASGQPVQAGERNDLYVRLRWRADVDSRFRHLGGLPDLDGLMTVNVPIGRGDLVLMPWTEYMGKRVDGIEVSEARKEPIEIALTRGASLTLAHSKDFEPTCLENHALLVLEDSQLPLVTGGFPTLTPPANTTINGVHLRIDDPTLESQRLTHWTEQTRLRGLVPGTYRVVAFPDDLAIEPASFVVEGSERVEVELRCTER